MSARQLASTLSDVFPIIPNISPGLNPRNERDKSMETFWVRTSVSPDLTYIQQSEPWRALHLGLTDRRTAHKSHELLVNIPYKTFLYRSPSVNNQSSTYSDMSDFGSTPFLSGKWKTVLLPILYVSLITIFMCTFFLLLKQTCGVSFQRPQTNTE